MRNHHTWNSSENDIKDKIGKGGTEVKIEKKEKKPRSP